MKRILLLTCLLTLLCAASAQAVTWFPNGYTLHRDPLCIHNDFSLESCFEKTLTMSEEEATAQSYLICGKCYVEDDLADMPASAVWYFNPDGGKYVHRDPECPSVSTKYRPMTGRQELASPDVIPTNACNICGRMTANGTFPIEYLFDQPVWNSTPEEKALMLPGVWTLPSENAIPFTEAMAIGKEWALQYSDKTIHSAIAFHYDSDPQGKPRETWQVVVSTTLMHPICIVHIDALTGEVYGGHISREYSDKMLLDNPEKLRLEASEGAKVELLANQVNLRETPSGDFIARLDKGDVLTLLGEGRKGMSLSYCVYSPEYGEGYVRSTYAQIIHDGKLRGNGSALTDNTLAYCQELRRWQIENGFLTKDESGAFIFTKDKSLNTDEHREALVALMHKHSITATVGGTAPFVLANHYGTADLWEIFGTTEDIIPGLRVEDWHSPDFPTDAEIRKLADALTAVDAEYH